MCNNSSNLFDALVKSSSGKNGITFVDNKGDYFLSYNELYKKSLGIAGFLRKKVNPLDNEIIIYLDSNIEFVPIFWACITAKIKAVPVAVGNSEEHKLKLFKVWDNLISPFLVTNRPIFDNLKSFAEQNGLADTFEEIKKRLILFENLNEQHSHEPEKISENDIAFIQYSSGSTGLPKGVILTHKNLIITTGAYIRRSDISSEDSFLSWFPLTHDMGLIGWHITPLVVGINQVLIETNLFVRRPALWMDKASAYKSTMLCAPNFGLKHFLTFTKKIESADWDLTKVRFIGIGAEPISAKLCDNFLNTLEPYGLKYCVMSPGYGLAEVGLAAALSDYKSNFETIHIDRLKLNVGSKISETYEFSSDCLSFVCEGSIFPELEVKIVDNKGNGLPEEYVGNILLKGDSVTSGYYNNISATKQTIKNGWLNTGDLGFLKNNKLFLTGRSKELIIINGYNYYPHDIERVCLSINELELGKIAAAGTYEESLNQEVLIIFVYYKNVDEHFIDLSNKIKEIILKTIGLNVHKVIPVKKIPKTTSGKVQRFILLENYKNGKYAGIVSKFNPVQAITEEIKPDDELSQEFIIEKLKYLVTKVINNNEIDLNESLINYGIDSIRGAELFGRVTNYFNIEFDRFIYLPDLSVSAVGKIVLNTIQQKKYSSGNKEVIPQSDNLTNIYPASSGQFSIYCHYKNYPLSPAYNISISCRILNEISIDKLNQAYSFVVNRHEILCSKYFLIDKLYYRTDNKLNKNIEVIETDDCCFENLKLLVKKQSEAPFDIENDCVIRSSLYKTKFHGMVFLINLHHIAGDARSLFILLNEILACYNELVNYNEIKSLSSDSECKYSDYVNKEVEYLNSNSIEIAKEYWKTNLSGIDFSLNLPSLVKDGRQNESGSLKFEVEHKSIKQFKNTTDFVFMLSAYCFLLHNYTRQKEIIVGIPVSDSRIISDNKMNEGLVGYAINSLPIKSILNTSDTVSEYLERMKQTVLDAVKHQHYPLSKIADDINPSRKSSDSLLQTMFTSLPVSLTNKLTVLADSSNEENEIKYDALCLKPFYIPQQESLFDLSMEMAALNDKVIFRISYNCAKYDKIFIERFADHFKNILKGFTSSSSAKLSGIEILSDNEKQVLKYFNNTQKEFPNYKPVIRLIEEQVAKTPGNNAYIYNDKQFTYEWVNKKANGLAYQLLNSGISKGSFIPLFMKKGIELPVSILAVMKAGCAFIPLDVDSPEKRLNVLVSDINPEIILTTKEHLKKLSFTRYSKIILADIENINDAGENPGIEITLDDPIYGIYTSGTTGIPKCAVNLHKGITNRFKYMDEYFGKDEQRIVYHSANYIFDTSVYQLFWPLTHGAKVVIPISFEKLNLDYMLELAAKCKVTYIDLVPSIFNILVEYFENNQEAVNKFQPITQLSIGGESIAPAFINRFRKRFPDIRITNIYGPTETSIGITFYKVKDKEDEIPIGKPISNTQILVLDENMNRVPIGITGEIYIGGEGVGSGYLNDPYKTAVSFIDNPFKATGKLYKTGDLGCYLPDGNILFKGRIDEQVKLNGVRIELQEIRANILKVDFVSDAVVVIKENGNGENQLAAYIVYKNGNHNFGKLKTELSKTLPEILIPQYFIRLDEIPLTANGKINKHALPEINSDNNEFADDYAGSSRLLDVWEEVLGRKDINVKDKFFNCGGNSLKALILKIKIQQTYGTELGIEKILCNPSILELEKELMSLSSKNENIIPKVEQREYYPLSNQQKRMWLLCNDEKASNAYNMLCVFHLTGKVDLPALRESWEILVKRHESLRTKYVVIQGEPVQIIENDCQLDFREIYSNKIEFELKQILESEKKYSFDLSKLPLFKIITISDDENTKLVLHFHHIITDGWSAKIMFDESGSIYNSLLKKEPYEINELTTWYKDYSVWFQNKLESKELTEAEEYWNKKLSGELPVTSIPADYKKSKLQNGFAGIKRFFICNDSMKNTLHFCEENEITLFMLLVGAVEVVLSKYSNSEEIVLGLPVSGRNYPGLENQIGLYVNTIVIRNKVNRDNLCSEFINELKNEILESFKYQDYPYDKLVEARNVNNVNNLFDVFVSYGGIEDEPKLNLGNSEIKYEEIENKECKFGISLMFREKADRIELLVEYADELYKEERIERLASHIENALEGIIYSQNKKLKSINILSKDEETKLLQYSSVYKESEVIWKSIVEQFKDTVKTNENNTAVSHQGNSLTYKQLDTASDIIASELIDKGIKEECIVGLLTTKSLDMIVGILGILKAGAAYLPLDPGHPMDRLQIIVKDSNCKAILTNIDVYSQDTFACELLNVNKIESNTCNNEVPIKVIKPSQLAYVIYTSGSTGTPKGVMIEHHSLNNLINSLRNEVYVKYGQHLNVALQASFIFDASVQQIFPALVRGDVLHLIDDETKLDGKQVEKYFNKYEIDIADATPALFDLQLRNGFVKNKCQSLKHLLIGGEQLSYELLKRFYHCGFYDDVIITNMYGPTECTVDTTCFTITKEDCKETGIVSIGKPMLNTEAYILDEDLQLVPEGITGELYLGGRNVGRGYVNNDELTKSKFISSPFDKNKTLYRTGDLCSFSYDGNIIYQGRIDNQIKIRGYRIEPGEIENVIEKFVEYSKCIVVFDKEKERLAAFLEKGNNGSMIPDSLYEHLRSRLPAYMCPDKIIEIEKIPLTPSGKPDRNKLAAIVADFDGISFNRNYSAPQNDTEKILVDIWKDVLGIDEIGINDNFYELGGHSLKSLKIMSGIVKEFGVEISYKDILTNSTIKELASIIDSYKKTEYNPIPKVDEKEYYELSHAQKRIWLECELGRSAAYNIVGGFSLSGKLDVNLIDKSFVKVVNRHESLRTRFKMVNGQPKQVIGKPIESIVNFTDISSLSNTSEILENEIKKTAVKSLNIFNDELVYVSLFKVKDDGYYLLVLLHHIVIDGWSIKIMLEEFSRIYNGYKSGVGQQLTELPIQYKDYSAWFEKELESKRFKESEKYWKDKIVGELPHLPILTIRKQAEVNEAGKVKKYVLNKDLTHSIHEYTRQREVTVFIFMLSVLEIVLYKYTDNDEIILGTPVSGRNHPDLDRQLGLYINVLVLRNKIQSTKKYYELLNDLKDEVLESYSHQDYPFNKLIEDTKGRNSDRLFNIFISYETEDDEIKLNLNGITCRYTEVETGTSKFDISLIFRERKNVIELIIEYSNSLYDDESIGNLCTDIEKMILSVINNDEQVIDMLRISSDKIYADTNHINEDNKRNNKRVKTNKYMAPISPVEKDIAILWKKILEIKRIGTCDNFFELGGQSIKAMQLVTSLKEKYSINLDLKFVFSNQTILEQAKEIENIIWINRTEESSSGEEIII